MCCDFKSTVMAVDRTERGLNGMDIVKVSIMGICGMMLGFILKETRPEFAVISQFWLRLSGLHISDSFHLQSAKMPDIR